MPKIELRHVYKVFGREPKQAVDALRAGTSRDELQVQGSVAAVIDATFQVEAGEIFVVMGLSGSGKSTLVRTINQLHPVTAGEVFVDGEEVSGLDARELRALRARKISMVFQHFGLFPHRTVVENAGWGLEVQRVDKDERLRRATEALEMVGLAGWGERYPNELSGGMQQRVGLARALATDSDILLMDEAFSALDPLIRREMQDQLIDLQESIEKTIVFITHDLNEAMRMGDRIAVMKDGRIVQIGTSEDILTEPANDYVEAFVQDVDRSRVLTAGSVMEDPVARIDAHEGPRAAIREMRERQVSALFVTGPQRRLHGVIFDAEVTEAARRGDQGLDAIVHRDFPSVEPDTYLSDVLVPSAESTFPVPVVADGRLVGVVPRVTLLAALGGGVTGGSTAAERIVGTEGEARRPSPTEETDATGETEATEETAATEGTEATGASADA